jgi:hypothetical protein
VRCFAGRRRFVFARYQHARARFGDAAIDKIAAAAKADGTSLFEACRKILQTGASN